MKQTTNIIQIKYGNYTENQQKSESVAKSVVITKAKLKTTKA